MLSYPGLWYHTMKMIFKLLLFCYYMKTTLINQSSGRIARMVIGVCCKVGIAAQVTENRFGCLFGSFRVQPYVNIMYGQLTEPSKL